MAEKVEKTKVKKVSKVKTKKTAKKVVKKAVKKAVGKKAGKKASPRKRVLTDYSLVVVESPSKASTIKKYLGRGYQVIASNGHIKDLPKSKLGVDVKNNFEIDLQPISGKTDKIARIKELAAKANDIFLAPDMDREGEAIAFHIKEEIGIRKKNVYRVVFNAVTKNAVKTAIENPTVLNQGMYDSQRTRRILDRLVGYKISPILWDKIQRGISAGRVQSVALRIIVERDDEIQAFTPEQWFSIEGVLQKGDHPIAVKYYGETSNKKTDLTEEPTVDQILADVKDHPFHVSEVKKRERKQKPTPPFTTSKLQQEAANKLGFSTKKTMMLAQKLYEGVNLSDYGHSGLITYMRTDSVRTEPESLDALREYVKERYGEQYLSAEAIVYKKKGKSKVQDAHEAIRPTSLEFSPDKIRGDLDKDEQRLYEMIWNKFISSQMANAVIDQTTVNIESNGHFFRANGSIVKFPGFRTVYLEAAVEARVRKGGNDEENESTPNSKNQELPEIFEGDLLTVNREPQKDEHWTSPPPRYNEASLVKTLEEKGIGRPSTYASIISNIQDRGYVEKTENRFLPTELGIVVCRMLVESFPEVMDVAFTAKVEELLDLIEDGEIKYKKVLKEFWKDFEVTLKRAQEEMKNLKRSSIPTGIKCHKCEDGEYNIKWGRNGQFMACSNYPDCTSTQDFKKQLDGTLTIIPKQYVKDPCPTCGKRMIVKTGRYGRFVTCEEYPNCKTALPFSLGIQCPECKKGTFVEKKSRYGKLFYGCSSYPDCENALWNEPIEKSCVKCGYPVVMKRVTKKLGHHYECPKCRHKEQYEVEEENVEEK